MVLYAPELSIIDDHTLTGTLLVGKAIPLSHHVIPSIGRFFPLNGQDLNVLSALFFPSPAVFYAFNALCVLLVSACLVYSLRVILGLIVPDSARSTKAIKLTAYALVAFLLLTPAFNGSWLRLFVPERMEFVFLSIMLASYAFVLVRTGALSVIALVVGTLSAMIACFYKETAFILIGSFAFMHLVLSLLDSRLANQAHAPSPLESSPRRNAFVIAFDVLLLVVCAVWVVAYYALVLAQKTTSGRYGDTPHDPLIMLVKNFFTYAMNEPFLFIVIPALLLARLIAIIAAITSAISSAESNPPLARISPFIPLLDSNLFASALFLLAYLVLNISSAHYPLPAYIFALPALGWALLYMARMRARRPIIARVFIAMVVLSAVIFASNSLPYAAHTIAHYKGVPHNFQSTLHFLADHATPKSPQSATGSAESSLPKSVNIMLDGVDCTLVSQSEVCYSFKPWLKYYGVEANVIPDTDLYNPLRKDSSTKSSAPQSQNPSTIPPESNLQALPENTFLILTPFSSNFINSEYIQHLDSVYERVYSAEFGWNLGFVGVKALMKYMAVKRGGSGVAFSGNVWNLPVHFYVYKRK